MHRQIVLVVIDGNTESERGIGETQNADQIIGSDGSNDRSRTTAICKILGWHGPQRHELTGPGGAPFVIELVIIDPQASESLAIEYGAEAVN